MKLKQYAFGAITVLSLEIGFQINLQHAKADTYYATTGVKHYMPKSWRGTYYTTAGDVMKVSTYSISQNGKNVYKSSWHGWRKLAFGRINPLYATTRKHKVYTLNASAKYGYETSHEWRLTRKNGKAELIHYGAMGSLSIWHKYYAKRSSKSRTTIVNTDSYNLNYTTAKNL
ncbi:hypothetical protein ACFP1H_12495 [Secundilactobacillus hailunensis]|uniref:Surface layer protein A domain-containing protein n=1 Tax=Secundilactobacillus hailunensis TaxID=2559923 RepID=A0ABW1TCG7_9LACO|nr:hypothetical protein [Secundilactobacillus hailunensis]